MRLGSRVVVAVVCGTVLFGACRGGPEPTSHTELENATYLSDATSAGVVSLVGGAFDFPPGGEIERIEMLTSTTGDFDGDDKLDAAVVLVEFSGRARLHRVHALMGDGKAVEDVSARMIGDRVKVEAVRVVDGVIEVDLLVHAPGSSVEEEPTLPVTSKLALTDRGLIPVNPPTITAGASQMMEAGSTATLFSHEWVVESIEMGDWSQTTDALERRPALRFASELGDASAGSGTVSGYAGCNQVFGAYSNQADGSLRVMGLAATRRMCPGKMSDLEERLISTLASAQSFEITNDRMTIAFNGGTLRLAAGSQLDPPETHDSALPRGEPSGPEGEAEAKRRT